jgi:hypothetical protein
MHLYQINVFGQCSILRIGLELHTVCMNDYPGQWPEKASEIFLIASMSDFFFSANMCVCMCMRMCMCNNLGINLVSGSRLLILGFNMFIARLLIF